MAALTITIIKTVFKFILEAVMLPSFLTYSLFLRSRNKTSRIGIGPLPLINNIYHKKALQLYGWNAETFAESVFHITDEFDVRLDYKFKMYPSIIRSYLSFFWLMGRYTCVYTYFNGLTLSRTLFLYKFESFILKFANIKVVVLAYGSDVQEMTRTPNLNFKHAMAVDYPVQSRKRKRISSLIDTWMRHGSHIVGGCEWVDYLAGWDSLMIAHFSIDTNRWQYSYQPWRGPQFESLKVLHAPNHRVIKGTEFLIKAINELKREGLNIELVLLEKVPNNKIQEVMNDCHVVVDQLVIGWYAMFAIEAMSTGKPVICNVRTDLKNLYEYAGLLKRDEIPLIHSDVHNIQEVLRHLYENPQIHTEISKRGREYVQQHHSVESVGTHFDLINKKLGLMSGNNV